MYALEGRATDTYLKNEAQATGVEQSRSRDDVREDLLAISRAGHASRRARSMEVFFWLARTLRGTFLGESQSEDQSPHCRSTVWFGDAGQPGSGVAGPAWL